MSEKGRCSPLIYVRFSRLLRPNQILGVEFAYSAAVASEQNWACEVSRVPVAEDK